ncbi:MAG: fused MFS/spermidine synthase [Desulfobacteraceae bacterium]
MSTDWPAGDWYLAQDTPDDLSAYRKTRVLAQGRTRFQEYQIWENPFLGRVLVLDGVIQSAQRDEFIYHEALVHPPLTAHPEPRQVAILGGGEGATLREVLKHNCVERVVMVDLDAEIVALCRQWLPTFHAGAFDDPRVELRHEDARGWLARQSDRSFDVILMDITDPLAEGPAVFLFTREMFELVQVKLTSSGLFSIQSGSAERAPHLIPHLYHTVGSVFPQVFPYTAFIASFDDLYGFMLAGKSLNWPSPATVAQRLAIRQLPALRWYGPEFSTTLPLLPPYIKAHIVRAGRVCSDAHPLLAANPGA